MTSAAAARAETLAVIPGVPETVDASAHAFHVGIAVCAWLVAAGGSSA